MQLTAFPVSLLLRVIPEALSMTQDNRLLVVIPQALSYLRRPREWMPGWHNPQPREWTLKTIDCSVKEAQDVLLS